MDLCTVIKMGLQRGCRKPERAGKTIPKRSFYETCNFIEDLESQNKVGNFTLSLSRVGRKPCPLLELFCKDKYFL